MNFVIFIIDIASPLPLCMPISTYPYLRNIHPIVGTSYHNTMCCTGDPEERKDTVHAYDIAKSIWFYTISIRICL